MLMNGFKYLFDFLLLHGNRRPEIRGTNAVGCTCKPVRSQRRVRQGLLLWTAGFDRHADRFLLELASSLTLGHAPAIFLGSGLYL